MHAAVPFAELYAKTGIQFNTFNTVYQLLDDERTGRMERAKAMLMLPDYFHFRLTGVKKQEYTNATTTGMVNALTHTWDGEIIERLGYKKELFGELSQPGTEVGEFTDEVAAIVGYKAKVVLPATHDTASAVLAAPLSGQTPYISSGTWSLLGVEQNGAYTSAAAREADYSNEGSVGFTFRLQKNIMGLWMIQQVRHELDDKYSFAELASLARENPVPDEIDVNDRRFLAPKSMIDEINGAVGRKLGVGETAYVIFNNLARSYQSSLDALEKVTGKNVRDAEHHRRRKQKRVSQRADGQAYGKKDHHRPDGGHGDRQFPHADGGQRRSEGRGGRQRVYQKLFRYPGTLKIEKIKDIGRIFMSRYEEAKKMYAAYGIDTGSRDRAARKNPRKRALLAGRRRAGV